MATVTKKSIEEDRLNCVSSSSIRHNYLFYALSLPYNYFISWFTYSLLLRS